MTPKYLSWRINSRQYAEWHISARPATTTKCGLESQAHGRCWRNATPERVCANCLEAERAERPVLSVA